MKIKGNTFVLFLILSSLLYFTNNAFGQSKKKNKARLNVTYVKIMNQAMYFDIKASSRIKKETVKLSGIEIDIFNTTEDGKVKLGKVNTDAEGEGRFYLENMNMIIADSTNIYHMLFTFKGNDSFKSAKRSLEFKNADLEAKIIEKDSTFYVSAKLTDGKTREPLEDQSLTVKVKRLFRSLLIGKEFNNTDENGSILIPVEKGIPGIDGNLTFEVSLNESDDFGTVKTMTRGAAGKPIIVESTFDQRTMWSPRNKTPIFFLIFPNLLIIGIWGFIIYLISNLFKISKL